MHKLRLESFLFKNKLNLTSLTEFIDILSEETCESILNDLTHDDNLKLSHPTQSEIVFTDGGCINNGKASARAAYAIYFKNYPELNSSQKLSENPTNQYAELSAILCAINAIYNNINLFLNKNIVIYSDSAYSIKCVTQWIKTWKNNGWKTANKKDVKNSVLIKSISDGIDKIKNEYRINIEFKHVFSHTQEPQCNKSSERYQIWLGNKIVDEMVSKILHS